MSMKGSLSDLDAGPHFLGIGAQRAGTTWVNDMLETNPRLWLPPIKEVHFFDIFPAPGKVSPKAGEHARSRLRAWAKEPGWRSLPRSPHAGVRLHELAAMARFDVGLALGRRDPSRYRRLFRPAIEKGKITGEITPAYSLLSLDQVQALRAALRPDLKIFIVLRDPIDRMWSHVTKDFHRMRGARPDEVSWKDALAFIEAEPCRARTRYAETLRTWFKVFGEERVMVAWFDEIAQRPSTMLARLETFLGVERETPPDILPAINAYRRKQDMPPLPLRRRLAEISLEETGALMNLCPSIYAEGWLKHAEDVMAGAH